jgi:hypothetical protein
LFEEVSADILTRSMQPPAEEIRVDGCQTLATDPIDQPIDLAA